MIRLISGPAIASIGESTEPMAARNSRQRGDPSPGLAAAARPIPRPGVTNVTVTPGEFPPEFDPEWYQHIHADVWPYSLAEVHEHYRTRGRDEGRQPNSLTNREAFRDLALGFGPILEIGPPDQLLFSGRTVTRLDLLDRQALGVMARTIEAGGSARRPPARQVPRTGHHPEIRRAFGVVASNHAIGHQPDLIHHLRQVARVLKPGGYVFLWIPDKRYCLDHFQAESTIAEVIEAAAERRRFHILRTLIAQEVLRAHNDPRRHWLGDHGEPPDDPAAIVRAAQALYAESLESGDSVDRHAWQFTPDSFRAIIAILNELELSTLRPLRVYDTLFPHNEFWAILEKP